MSDEPNALAILRFVGAAMDSSELLDVDDEDYDTERLVSLLAYSKRLVAAARNVERSLRAAVGKRLMVEGPYCYGQTWYRGARSWSEKCVDSDGFFEWVAGGDVDLEKLFNPNDVRVGQLPQAVRDTFFDKEWGKWDVESFDVNSPPGLKLVKGDRR